jgi:hypothetical protein
MGSGVSNRIVGQHRQAGTGIVDYRLLYHDDLVTGSAWVHSPTITPATYATLKAAAAVSEAAFLAAVANTAWQSFLNVYGYDSEVWLGVLDVK